MTDLSELFEAEARRLQPTDPPPFDDLVRTRQAGDRRRRVVAGSTVLVAAVVVTTTVWLGPLRQPAEPATPAAGSLTASLTLSGTTVRTGGSLTGIITVDNRTGHEIQVEGCAGLYAVRLRNPGVESNPPAWPACLEPSTIPVGRSTYPVRVTATPDFCAGRGSGPGKCPPEGQMPKLPYGDYEATTYAADPTVPLPAPVPVSVTSP